MWAQQCVWPHVVSLSVRSLLSLLRDESETPGDNRFTWVRNESDMVMGGSLQFS